MLTQKDFDKARELLNHGPLSTRHSATVADGTWILARRPDLILDKNKAYMITPDNEITEL